MCSFSGILRILTCMSMTVAIASEGGPGSSPATAGEMEAKPRELRVMSLNVRVAVASDGANAWTARREFLCDLLREAQPDLLGLQEAVQEQLDAIVAALPGRASVGVARDGDGRGEYSAIVYDSTRFSLLESGTFWLSDTPEVPSSSWGNRYLRVCTWGRFRDKVTGASFHVFNTHLDHEAEEARVRGVALIANRIRQRVDSGPFILMGDFNADESSASVAFLLDRVPGRAGAGLDLVDSYRAVHPSAPEPGTFHGFTGADDGKKIDHIFVPRRTTVLDAGIVRAIRDGRYPSDHFPVTAVIRLDGASLQE